MHELLVLGLILLIVGAGALLVSTIKEVIITYRREKKEFERRQKPVSLVGVKFDKKV